MSKSKPSKARGLVELIANTWNRADLTDFEDLLEEVKEPVFARRTDKLQSNVGAASREETYEHSDNRRQSIGAHRQRSALGPPLVGGGISRDDRVGILTADDRVELLEGWIVNKMPQNPPHVSSVTRIVRRSAEFSRMIGPCASKALSP